MTTSLFKLLMALLIIVIWVTTCLSGFEAGETYYGFKLLEKRFVKEVNAECFYFEHLKSGARLFKIAADDANKTFSIAFKTIPENDYGTPHMMEHSVLNGSRNFPVKSPFDVLSQGSLNTFLNAFTGNEFTLYPVASMNQKDYFNLMHVYLDAVFYPLIYQDPRILKQEGWHYELTDKEADIVYKGVVYNEMKGWYSDPTLEIDHWMYKYLFPNNGYGYDSGGYPREIPKLTYNYFLDFHRRFYHPSNSYIFLYGDADLEKELSFIDQKYLTDFERSDFRPEIPLQQSFERMKEISIPYAVVEDSDTTNQTYLLMSFIAGLHTDMALFRAFDVLTDVLVNHETAPIRLALQEAGIGKDVSASVYSNQQNIVRILVQNANSVDKDRFRDIVMNTMRDVVETGLDKEMLEGVINRLEFRLREGDDAQKGLTYIFRAIYTWFFAENPFLGLEYEKPLAEVQTALETDYLEQVIRDHLLDNHHSLLLVMHPEPGLEKEKNAQIAEELSKYKANLNEAELDALVKDTQDLLDYQHREDTPEALATIPLLELQDINPEAKWYTYQVQEISGIPILFHEDFTNKIVYSRLYFDIRVLPEELIPYAALLAEMMGSLNTENYDYGDLSNALNIHTGGFNTALNTFLENKDDNKFRPKFILSCKAMNQKLTKMFELIEEVVNRTSYEDKERLKTVLTRHQSRLDNEVKQNGYGFTKTRLTSYFSNAGMLDELTGGIEYYWFVTNLVNNFDEKFGEIQANLTKVTNLLFRKENFIAGVICQKDDLNLFTNELTKFVTSLPEEKISLVDWKFNFEKRNEGFLTASQVQYVLKGYDFKRLGYDWNGKMLVLDQILTTDWLQNRIRVIGGAYGGWSSISSTGWAYFASYRDPNLRETLENYDTTPKFLENFQASDTAMTRFIIGTVATYLDRPLTPSQRGDWAFRRYFEKMSREEYQSIRNAVLSTTSEDIRMMEKMISDILTQDVYCVYGNEEKLQSEKELFKNLISLSQ